MKTLYDDASVHSMMKPSPLSTVDQSQIAADPDSLERQLQAPAMIIDSCWLSDELHHRDSTQLDEPGRRPPAGGMQVPVNPVVPLVVEAKAAEDEDDRDAR